MLCVFRVVPRRNHVAPSQACSGARITAAGRWSDEKVNFEIICLPSVDARLGEADAEQRTSLSVDPFNTNGGFRSLPRCEQSDFVGLERSQLISRCWRRLQLLPPA